MLLHVVPQKLTDVSEVLTAAVINAIVLVMEAVSTSETSANLRLHGTTSQKTDVILASMKN
jgi:hypothetical protein